MRDLILGAVTDYGPDAVSTWVESINATGFDGKKSVIIYNSGTDLVEYFMDNGFEVVMIGKLVQDRYLYRSRSYFNVCVDRFFHAFKYLKTLDNQINNVVMTDVKDVVFQSLPFKNFENLGKSVVLTTENIRYRDEPWGKHNIEKAFPSYAKDMMDREIYNAGVIAGKNDEMFRNFLVTVYAFSMSSGMIYVEGGGGPDQAALNIIASMQPWNSHIHFSTVGESIAAQAGTTNDPAKIEHFSRHWVQPHIPQFNSETLNLSIGRIQKGVTNFMGELYPIVHQYDRVPEWKEYFTKKDQ